MRTESHLNKLRESLAVTQKVAADSTRLGMFWALGPVGTEQPTLTFVNSWSLKQNVFMQIACWEQFLGCFGCQTVARNYLEEFSWHGPSRTSGCGNSAVGPVPGPSTAEASNLVVFR